MYPDWHNWELRKKGLFSFERGASGLKVDESYTISAGTEVDTEDLRIIQLRELTNVYALKLSISLRSQLGN